MSTKLTLKDRFELSMYARRLPCTLSLRLAISDFLEQIDITQNEYTTYNISLIDNKFTCSDSSYVVEYTNFSEIVVNAMKDYIKMYNHESNKENVLLQNMISAFNKII